MNLTAKQRAEVARLKAAKARQKVLEALQRAEGALLRGQCENALVAVLEARRAIEGRP